MKKELMAATAMSARAAAAFVFVPGAALAQTVPINWTGIYIGLAAGGGKTDDRVSIDSGGFFSNPSFLFHNTLTNATMIAGINWDAGAFVFGFEGDANFIRSHNEGSASDGDGGFFDVETDLDHLMTLRARLGVKVNRAMLFGTGGLAVANASLSTSHTESGKTGFASGEKSQTLWGWSAGGGVEIAASDRVFINLTGLYYRLSPLTVNAAGLAVAGRGERQAELADRAPAKAPSGSVTRSANPAAWGLTQRERNISFRALSGRR
jgi:outer membrane immunogenic protein